MEPIRSNVLGTRIYLNKGRKIQKDILFVISSKKKMPKK